MSILSIPELSLVALIGAGSGKADFIRKYFKPTELVALDNCLDMVADGDDCQSATDDAFDLLCNIVTKRLKRGLLTVIDATDFAKAKRKRIVELARACYVAPVALVFDCEINPATLETEGFRHVTLFDCPEDAQGAAVSRSPLWSNRKELTGPFDIIGDLHGCFNELYTMVLKLGYNLDRTGGKWHISHPDGRRLIFLGDLGDRGPKICEVFNFVMDVTESSGALCLPGNHDMKLLRHLKGKNVTATHGLDKTLACLNEAGDAFKERLKNFLYGLVEHYVLDGGRLIVAHAGLKEEMHGRVMPPVQEFALYGETTGERDEFNLPVRHNWAQEYKGGAVVVYGHVAVLQAVWINNTIDIDTGCVYGNKLTALRYPERELVSVPAESVYYAPIRPLERNMPEMNEIKIIKDKYALTGDDFPRVIIHKENIAAALEVMSRFAVHPKWLVYLPPTMSPPDISNLDGFLEHPLEAFEYYRSAGLSHLICEEKHMGTRVCLVIARDEAAIERRFQIEGEGCGKCYTRTGRNYFTDRGIEEAFLREASDLLSKTNFWEEFETDWAVFDCEMMPWSYNYGKLVKSQYAAISSAAEIMLSGAEKYIEQASAAGLDLSGLAENIGRKKDAAKAFRQTYSGYCREVEDLSGLKLAPFHLLAVEGRTFFNKNHQWHLEAISLYCQGTLFQATPHIQVDLTDNASIDAAVDWWLKITADGSEGMVVKPFDYIARDGNKIYQPAIKCRGREHLRLIYGVEYLFPSNLKRLKVRKLKKKRSLAVKEFTSGIRGLSRFVRNEALDLVHDAVFAVLALESEDVDPQL